jgi:hypothetical protein
MVTGVFIMRVMIMMHFLFLNINLVLTFLLYRFSVLTVVAVSPYRFVVVMMV